MFKKLLLTSLAILSGELIWADFEDKTAQEELFMKELEEEFPFKEKDKAQVKKVKEEVFTILLKSLNLNPSIPLVSLDSPETTGACQDLEDYAGRMRYFVQINPDRFFALSKQHQIRVLLHELRHSMQYNKNYRKMDDFSQEVQEQFKKIRVQKEEEEIEEWIQQFRLGKYYDDYKNESEIIEDVQRHRLQEVDADYFSYSHMRCPDCLRMIQKETLILFGNNNEELLNQKVREMGYFVGPDIDQFIHRAEQSPEYCVAHQDQRNGNLKESDSYTDYMPQHLLQKAE